MSEKDDNKIKKEIGVKIEYDNSYGDLAETNFYTTNFVKTKQLNLKKPDIPDIFYKNIPSIIDDNVE